MVLPSHRREFYLNPSIIFRESARTSNTTHARRPNLASCPDQHDPGLSWRSLARKRTRSSCALPNQALERDAAWKKFSATGIFLGYLNVLLVVLLIFLVRYLLATWKLL